MVRARNPERNQSMAAPEVQAVKEIAADYERMADQIGKVIVGQHEVVEQLIMALFSRGHCLLVGVPGLAKTLLVSTVAPIMQIGKVIVGQHEVVEQLIMALFSRGHCLLVGVPGLAKTLLVSTVARIM